jgi:hypothetical protein
MIQFKRGTSENWSKHKTVLAPGQPGYDKDRHKIKIGDGKTSWNELPDVSGLGRDEIIDSEKNAKNKAKKNPILNALLKVLGINPNPIITYGTDAPDENTLGQVYLQHYNTLPEADYIVDYGQDIKWTYQIFNSGMAFCRGIIPVSTSIQSPVGNGCLYTNDIDLGYIDYPLTFKNTPTEVATVTGAKNHVVWLASVAPNEVSKSGLYTLLSYDKQITADYCIILDVRGEI